MLRQHIGIAEEDFRNCVPSVAPRKTSETDPQNLQVSATKEQSFKVFFN
jgi:hypothetical protein